MEKITLPNAPAGLSPMDAAIDYSFGEGKFARVILEMSEGTNDHFLIKAQAYEMDAEGRPVLAPKGYPSRSRQTTHTVATSSIGTVTRLVPGWVRVIKDVSPDNLPEGTETFDALPARGENGQSVYVDPYLYKWDKGVVLTIAEGKVEELQDILNNSAVLSNVGFDHNALNAF